MKKVERSILLFLVLVLVLSSGGSYVALNSATKSNTSEDNQKMTVALVNEDQGADFNGQKYEFGKEFIKSIEKDEEHNWYVVSRGVAESGLERNSYNMMIVIPNDFTQKALSIDSQSPEQVVLNYKINASDNSNFKAKAEKTASAIIGDFNRRIIDVYFASVIGNLHEAQDNISTIIKKEQLYTSVYNNAIHGPLEGYTSQFGAVQSNTNVSRESFKGFQDILKDFENNLGLGVQTGKEYQSTISDYNKMKATNALVSNNFSVQLSDFSSQMKNKDLLAQLDYLIAANNEINKQFQLKENQPANIMTEASALQLFLSKTKEQVENTDTDLADQLASDMQSSISEKLKKEIRHSSGEEQSVYLNNFFVGPDEKARRSIQKQIDRLPSLNPSDLNGIAMREETITQLRNVMALSNKYSQEFNYVPSRGGDSLPLLSTISQIRNSLITDGVTLADSVIIPENKKKSGQEFSIKIPEGFVVTQLLLTLPNSEEMDYTRSFVENNKVNLPQTSEGNFGVKVKVKMLETTNNINVYEPVKWSWRLDQKDVTDVDTPDVPEIPEEEPASPETPEEGSTSPEEPAEPEEPINEGKTELPVVETATAGATVVAESLITEEQDDTQPTEGAEENTTEEPIEGGDPTEEKEPVDDPEATPITIVEKLKIVNNLISHQLLSPLVNDSTSSLINAASDTVKDYQKLLALYDVYLGVELDQFSRSEFAEELNHVSLKDLATEDSLYYLFNKQDIVDILANFVAAQTTEEFRAETEELKAKIEAYLELVYTANDNSKLLTELIQKTMAQAEVQNTNLTKTLADLAKWREVSTKLQEEQAKILGNGDDEQKAVLALDSNFSSLLASSQSLADQSKSNLTSADHVYDTFDAIDNQAKDIQASGTTLVKQAGELSNNLTNKLAEDQDFAKNFAGVLANSRIGDRPNENLLSFLSNPVETKNAGVIMEGDSFTPYFIVLLCFIVALFTAYVISNSERKRLADDSFSEEKTLVGLNTPITILTTSIGVVEGLVIGLLSSYLLQMNEERLLSWVGVITLIMMTMLLVATYLLRQLKMGGMFILLVLLSLYLFLTEAIGLHFDKSSSAAKLKEFSPLQYVEKLLMEFGNNAANTQAIVFSLLAIMMIALVSQLFVVHRFSKNEEVSNEGITESM
ncbi:type VII secretion protein EsaA [Robertmurraya korlensis]|uniref:type VII secretion protein EsaA n=1 Tax=Robertmurraya korlensis TaxID=519977 RepID=UPI000825800C|nr:type VII secretion protein EsaA [Robertmurraya korlensis]